MKNLLFLLSFVLSSFVFSQTYTLTSVEVNALNDSWCGDVEETNWPFIGCTASPDPYATLTDADGNLIFQSASNIDNFSLNLTLNISLVNFPYTLTIWDEDGVAFGVGSNDDNMGDFILDGSQTGTFTLSNSGSTITVSIIQSLMGCTDINAINYDINASMNDGSCIYSDCTSDENLISIDILTDQWGYETSIQLINFEGETYLDVSDFADATLSNFNVCVPNTGIYSFVINDEYGDGICCEYGDGYYTITACGELVASGGNFGDTETVIIQSCDYVEETLFGCTDINAYNYNPLANGDDGSCLYFDCPSDVTPDADNLFYAPEGSVVFDSDIQLPFASIGETYEEYIQFYAPNQLDLDGTSIQFNNVQINSIGNLPNGLSYQCSNGNCSFFSNQVGCIGILGTPLETGVFLLDFSASVSVSYDAGILGNIDIEFDIPYYGGNTWLDFAGVDASLINSIVPDITLIVQESTSVLGCTDPLANNYDPLSNEDNGSCDYEVICEGLLGIINLQTTSFSEEISWEILTLSGDVVLSSSSIYFDNSEYIFEVCLNENENYLVNSFDSEGDGWMGAKFDVSIYCDSSLFSILNISPEVGYINEYSMFTSCFPEFGCLDPQATNFNEIANIDDGSCTYPIYGCTDPLAVNYNEIAEIEDNSCSYFECDELEVLEAGFFPPEGSSFNNDSTSVFLPTAILSEFYDQNLQFYSDELITIEGLEVGFISAKINQVNNMPEGMYYETSSTDSTFYPQNTGCVGLFGVPENIGVYNLSIEATVTVEVLGSPISFDLPYQGGVIILDLIFSDGNYSSLNNFIPTFVIEVLESSDSSFDIFGCTDINASNYNEIANVDNSSCTYSQFISLNEGWSFFSTYISPEIVDITQVFNDIIDEVVIIKNNSGNAYLPEWNFNGIGDMIIGQGYQIKLLESSSLLINGSLIIPEENSIELLEGWNLIAYLRFNSANVISVLQEIVDLNNLVIAKDYFGNAYLPDYEFNGIGEFIPGQGYQLKVFSNQELLYLSNDEEY